MHLAVVSARAQTLVQCCSNARPPSSMVTYIILDRYHLVLACADRVQQRVLCYSFMSINPSVCPIMDGKMRKLGLHD